MGMPRAARQEAILRTRLFGYAVLFRAREVAGGFEPVDVTAADEAKALARELELHVGEPVGPNGPGGEMGISVPFGRCGIDGRPLEHVRVLHAEQAWVDTLNAIITNRPEEEQRKLLHDNAVGFYGL